MWKYINYKVKTREGVSNLNIDPSDPNSRLTTSDKEKAGVLGQFFSSVFTLEPPGNIPHIEAAALNDVMDNLVITEQTVKQKLDNLKDLLTPFWLFPAMPALMTTTNINSIVFGE